MGLCVCVVMLYYCFVKHIVNSQVGKFLTALDRLDVSVYLCKNVQLTAASTMLCCSPLHLVAVKFIDIDDPSLIDM